MNETASKANLTAAQVAVCIAHTVKMFQQHPGEDSVTASKRMAYQISDELGFELFTSHPRQTSGMQRTEWLAECGLPPSIA